MRLSTALEPEVGLLSRAGTDRVTPPGRGGWCISTKKKCWTRPARWISKRRTRPQPFLPPADYPRASLAELWGNKSGRRAGRGPDAGRMIGFKATDTDDTGSAISPPQSQGVTGRWRGRGAGCRQLLAWVARVWHVTPRGRA
eukprot:gene17999-biopygen21906